MLTIVEGDLLNSKETYLCHQCNCLSNGAAFLAAAIFKTFPYSNIYALREKPDVPGAIVIKGDGDDERFVINILSQYYPGYSVYPDAKLDGIKARLSYFAEALTQMKPLKGSFAFPWRFGCGAAGGDWDVYLKMLQDFASERDVVIYRLASEKVVVSPQGTLF
jgi:hypothetical protein